MKIRTQDYNEVTVIELQGELVSDFGTEEGHRDEHPGNL